MKLPLITTMDENHSKKKLENFYHEKHIPAEKKNYLTHLKASTGPYLGVESEYGKTHYLMDAASQIATLGLGFSPSVFMGAAHFLESWTNDSKSTKFRQLTKAFERFLKRKTNWKYIDVTYCNSGAEANEIALGYCFKRRKNKKAKKVLAFQASFHGRMLVSLASTWNPSKREPFAWDGYDTVYCSVPELDTSDVHIPTPKEWRKVWDNSPAKDLSIPESWNNDPHLKAEVDSLLSVKKQLETGDIFSIIIEPMQCEGGDRYLSSRWHTGLLLMARSYGVQVIHDEVQTGFHLGREFFWHRMLDLRDLNGAQLNPDYVICAKKSQVGMVLSPHHLRRRGIERKEQYQVASVVRGYLHGLALDQSRGKIHQLETLATPLLERLIHTFPKDLERPRMSGLAFAFDLKDKEKVATFIGKRFDHGLLYYPAGERTLRFRLNTSFSEEDLIFLFERLHDISRDLFDNEKIELPFEVNTIDRHTESDYKWQELILKLKLNAHNQINTDWTEVNNKVTSWLEKDCAAKLTVIDKGNIETLLPEIDRLQKEVYEPARQTSLETFKKAASHDPSTCIALIKDSKILGMALASPLEDFPLERGLRQDPSFHDKNSLYVIDTTVSNECQRSGLGRKLKYALTVRAIEQGHKRINGRNRDQLASSMLRINLSLGAFELFYLEEDYPDENPNRDVIYYQGDLTWERPHLNLSNNIDSNLGADDLDQKFIEHQLPSMVNKVCLSNFVSQDFLENFKDITKQLPSELRHAFSASGQSECVDKLAKSIWVSTKKGPTSLTFEGHYFGSGSFLSRSLSSNDEAYFPVSKLPHPTSENYQEVLKLVEKELSSKEHLATWIEPLPQNLMEKVPHQFLKELKGLCQTYKTPLIFNETTSSRYGYSNKDFFACEDKEISPDAGMCFFGGQAGMVFLKDELYFEKPLMMISTWDGDEFSLATYHRDFSTIKSDPSAFHELTSNFEKKLKELLKPYPISEISLEGGKGFIKGSLPFSIQRMFTSAGDRFLINPTRSSMKRFLEEYK